VAKAVREPPEMDLSEASNVEVPADEGALAPGPEPTIDP
jgi:hypothetical protein